MLKHLRAPSLLVPRRLSSSSSSSSTPSLPFSSHLPPQRPNFLLLCVCFFMSSSTHTTPSPALHYAGHSFQVVIKAIALDWAAAEAMFPLSQPIERSVIAVMGHSLILETLSLFQTSFITLEKLSLQRANVSLRLSFVVRVNVGALPAHWKCAVEVPLSKVINKKAPVEAGDIIAWASSAINPLDQCTTPTGLKTVDLEASSEWMILNVDVALASQTHICPELTLHVSDLCFQRCSVRRCFTSFEAISHCAQRPLTDQSFPVKGECRAVGSPRQAEQEKNGCFSEKLL